MVPFPSVAAKIRIGFIIILGSGTALGHHVKGDIIVILAVAGLDDQRRVDGYRQLPLRAVDPGAVGGDDQKITGAGLLQGIGHRIAPGAGIVHHIRRRNFKDPGAVFRQQVDGAVRSHLRSQLLQRQKEGIDIGSLRLIYKNALLDVQTHRVIPEIHALPNIGIADTGIQLVQGHLIHQFPGDFRVLQGHGGDGGIIQENRFHIFRHLSGRLAACISGKSACLSGARQGKGSLLPQQGHFHTVVSPGGGNQRRVRRECRREGFFPETVPGGIGIHIRLQGIVDILPGLVLSFSLGIVNRHVVIHGDVAAVRETEMLGCLRPESLHLTGYGKGF